MARLVLGVDARVLASPRQRGLVRYARCLLGELGQRDDVALHLFSPEPPTPAHAAGLVATWHVLPARSERDWALRVLPRALQVAGVAVFHAPADRGLPLRRVCPQLVTVHGWYERQEWRRCFRGAKARAWYWVNELAHRFTADAILTVSREAKRRLAALGVAPASRIRVVPLAAGREFTAAPALADAAVLAGHGITGRYILWVGGYDVNKNVECVIAAFDRLGRRDISLVLAGEKHWRYEELREWWSTLAAGERIHAVEPEPAALPALYRGCAATVVASRAESFGFPLAEAMACGVPVVCSAAPALDETGGDAPVWFSPDAPEELAERLAAVLDDPILRAEMVTRGLARSAAFDWQTAAAETMRVYREVARHG